MRVGLSRSSAAVKASIPVRCAPSAPARATISAWPSSTSAMSFGCTTAASDLTQLISVRSSAGRRRSSTAATSAASIALPRAPAKSPG
jgi:hypothetical protein